MNRLQANLCLICVTLYWSAEVILYACIPKGIPLFATSCVTSYAGGLLLLAAFWRRIREAIRHAGGPLVLGCLLLAALSALYNTMYLYGLKFFDVTTGAFTISMTIVVLPVALLTMHRHVSKGTWLSIALVTVGIILAMGPSLRGEQLPGLALMGGGCLLRAILIVILTDMVQRHDPIAIACFLELLAGILSLGGWLCEDSRLFFGLPFSRTLVASWAIYAYFIVAIAQVLNTFALKHVTAANATIVYSLEIIFSVIWGMFLPADLIGRVKITPMILLGLVFVFVGSLAEIIDFRGKREKHEEIGREANT